jgi:hypothetical protein
MDLDIMVDYMTEIKYPEIELILEKPINGYWDGGAKDYFTFTPSFFEDDSSMEEYSKKFKPNEDIRWGSFGANFFFPAKSGKSWNQAISIAKRKLLRKYTGDAKIKEIKVNWETQDNIDYD